MTYRIISQLSPDKENILTHVYLDNKYGQYYITSIEGDIQFSCNFNSFSGYYKELERIDNSGEDYCLNTYFNTPPTDNEIERIISQHTEILTRDMIITKPSPVDKMLKFLNADWNLSLGDVTRKYKPLVMWTLNFGHYKTCRQIKGIEYGN